MAQTFSLINNENSKNDYKDYSDSTFYETLNKVMKKRIDGTVLSDEEKSFLFEEHPEDNVRGWVYPSEYPE